jgi:hypothetical protein
VSVKPKLMMLISLTKLGSARYGTKSAFQNPNGVVSASRERPIFDEYFCVRAVYSSALDAYSKVLKRALSVWEGSG